MEMEDLKLAEISFRGAPTKSQMANALHDIQVFLNKAVGRMLATGEADAKDSRIVQSFNTIAHTMAAEESWKGDSGLVVPQPAGNARQVPR